MDTKKTYGVRRVVTAADVTATTITIPTFGNQLTGAVVQLVTAAGVPKAWNGAKTVTAESLVLDNTGVTDFVATDVFDVVMF